MLSRNPSERDDEKRPGAPASKAGREAPDGVFRPSRDRQKKTGRDYSAKNHSALERRPPRKRDGDDDLPGLPRASGNVAAKRACIACGRPFESEGWHNRMCPPCRRLSDPVR